MAQVLFSVGSSGTTANLDANFTELYGFAKNLVSDGSGNVGIGTASPAVDLEVSSASGQCNIAVRSTTGNFSAVNVIGNGNVLGATSLDLVQDGSSIAYVINRANAALVFGTNNNEWSRIDAAGNTIATLQASPPALAANSQMVINLTSDTNLRISVRGSDGTTRVANITLA